MNVFSLKSVGLYSLAVGVTVVFFQIVTSYGSSNLKAPISVEGNYLLNNQKLPGCLQNKILLLKLQQSGIYLNASLIKIDRLVGVDLNNLVEKSLSNQRNIQPTLNGKLIESTSNSSTQKFRLSGLLPMTACAQSSPLKMSGSLGEKLTPKHPRQLQGQIAIANEMDIWTEPVEFTGESIRSDQSNRSH